MDATLRRRERTLLHAGAADTRWHNLGCWAPGDDYPQAARRLAAAVGEAAGVAAGARVLDLACGAGASLSLWRDAFDAAAVVGVDLDQDVVREARAAWDTDDHAEIRCADACLPDGRDVRGFDAVVCVDAAYHMPLPQLAARAAAALRVGGGLGFTTLVRRGPMAPLLRACARACGVASGQPATVDELHSALAGAGFVDIDVTALDDRVLGRFRRHVRHLQLRWRDPAARRLLATAAMIDRVSALGYVCISARRA